MSDSHEDDGVVYHVVVNHEEQYSIWPADRDLPAGWRKVGMTGSKQECLDHIDEVWTDMRPLSLRRFMEEQAQQAADRPGGYEPAEATSEDAVEPLPTRLSRGDSQVEVSLRPERTIAAFKEAIDNGYVFLTFTQTRGGTELGVRLDRDASDLGGADFESVSGTVHLEGTLTLDFVPVRCHADIDLASLGGQGRLEVLEST